MTIKPRQISHKMTRPADVPIPYDVLAPLLKPEVKLVQ
jgi:hypothetical protein